MQFSPEENAKAITLIDEAVIPELGFTSAALDDWCSAANVPVPRKRDCSADFKTKAVERAREVGVPAAARELGLSPTTISRWCRAAKISLPRRRRKKYAAEFKAKTVKRARQIGVAATARELGVNSSTLYEWGKQINPQLAPTRRV